MNKSQLVEELASRTGQSKADAARVVDALFGEKGIVASELKKGRKVQITGFGVFVARRRPARIGRNPRTGTAMHVPEMVVPSFRAGQGLKDELNRKRR